MNLKQPQQQILPGILVLIVLLVYFYPKIAATENYFPLYPGIDTIYPPKFSVHKFNSISVGMSRKEVLELLGEPSYKGENYFYTKDTNYGIDLEHDGYRVDDTRWGYGIDDGCRGWCDFAWVTYSILFDSESSNAKVVRTGREIVYN
ncbi:hypothetical protein NDI44_04605 [Trichocoleus sp. DQ-A3]|uniref:hypothetical protein n=1 Tax=Cyanophyceae TaxID=3028117 RepID=UPI0016872D61|nr:hypothetical protein [Coleofasciculus sp. FACHB-125]MBD1900958.1 hypothetical protein [Coleofasciculus sp. FACHB-125]